MAKTKVTPKRGSMLKKKAKAPKATIGKKKTPTRVLKSQPVKKAVDATVVAAIDAAIAANGDESSDESGAALVGKAVWSYWELYGWCEALITEYTLRLNVKSGALSAQHKLVYKDGEDEWVAFPDASLVVSKEKPTEKPAEAAASTGAAAAAPGGGAKKSKSK